LSSIWKLGSVDVYVLKHKESGDVKLAKITPLNYTASSVLHYFGSGAQETTIDGWLFTDAHKATIQGYRDNQTTISLTSDQGNEGNFVIQTFDTDKYGPFVKLSLAGYSTTATIYKFQAKLIKTA
jgi:hypothetical protein